MEDKHILTKLNAIIYRLFRKWECSTLVESSFLDLVLWIPVAILHEIRASCERLCLLIESESDIQTNEQSGSISSPHQHIMTWLSRSKSKINAKVLTDPSQELIEIYKNRYGIGFRKSIMYMVKNLPLSLHENLLLCSTFFCRDSITKKQLIMSDFYPLFIKNNFEV